MKIYVLHNVKAVCDDGWKCQSDFGYLFKVSEKVGFDYVSLYDTTDHRVSAFAFDDHDLEPEGICAMTMNGDIHISWESEEEAPEEIASTALILAEFSSPQAYITYIRMNYHLPPEQLIEWMNEADDEWFSDGE